ncbi:MAG: phospho-N-acetylmuramoyl-pentapeptide-transferase [Hyphomonadaceae bacterium]|nr:MAG: phospho-N-acetylmuramoyl-pentapeptide-transferase [Hyphomonadaceae bacterium]KAF0186023.1 MAG: phospho-N-acetylmuramoyl-pentapeptide-transferase [Hyphomonadaceae bacterium]
MFYELFHEKFNLLNYITFRTGLALATAALILFIFGRPMIDWMRSKQGRGQPIRKLGPESHMAKQGTPTMGGAMILTAVSLGVFLWADLSNHYVWVVMAVMLGFGAIGFVDDYRKVKKQAEDGLSSKIRLVAEFIIAGIACYYIANFQSNGAPNTNLLGESIAFPFFKNALFNVAGGFNLPFFSNIWIDFGLIVVVLFGMIVIVGFGNAVNFTDGLDGLAIMPVMIASATFGLIVYLVGNFKFAEYLQLHFVKDVGETAVILGAILGAGLGFLWWNAPPAQIFMGDTGSLSLGGTLGVVAVASKHEFVLAIVGFVFVMELLSVVAQVASFKLTGKRVLLMAPLHHHFEKLHWKEPTIVIRFWIMATIFALIGLTTLKLR